MTARAATLQLEFRSWWLSGTGGGRGRHLDAVCHRDADGLPAMPMSQVKGTLRETAERLAEHDRAGWSDDLVRLLFGGRAELDGRSAQGAVAFLGDAEIAPPERAGLTGAGAGARRRRLFRRIPATQIDEQGAAADHSLRYVEAAVPLRLTGRLEWIGPDRPDCDWVAALDAACAATQAFGKLKHGGYGAAIGRIAATEAARPRQSAVDRFRAARSVCLLLTQTRPAVFSRRAATEGAHTTLDAPAGGTLLGWAAAEGPYAEFEDPYGVFHSGAVRFCAAVPLGPDGALSLPMPKLFMAPKHDAGGGLAAGRIDPETVRLGPPEAQADDDSPIQYEPLTPPFVTPDGTVVRPERGQRLRTATEKGRAAPSALFACEHLSGAAELVLAAWIERDATIGDNDWARLLAAFDGRVLRLGRARGTSYGGEYRCRLTDTPSIGGGAVPAGTSGRVRVLALSDLALVDPYGTPASVPDHAMLGLPPARFVGGESVVSLRRYAPWNARLNARDVDRQVIEAGSVMTFELQAPLSEALGARAAVGLWREAGLGQIWIAPPFLAGDGAPRFPGGGPRVEAPGEHAAEGAGPRPEAGHAALANWCAAQMEALPDA